MSEQQSTIFNILFNNDDITWQAIIYNLVRNEEMNPWDIDISLIAAKFLEKLKELKEMDFRISGKVLLASAILLKLKSNRLLDEDINALDSLIAGAQNSDDDLGFFDEWSGMADDQKPDFKEIAIVPRTPQPRKRKVSVFDLVKALEKALEVKARRPPAVSNAPEVTVPVKSRDISLVIRDMYKTINTYFTKKTNLKLNFNQLLPSDSKEDKVFTFIPLLYLDHQRKIDISQKTHHGDIFIKLLKRYAA